MGVVKLVMSGYQPWQHSGIRCVDLTGNQSQPDPRDRLHAEALEYRDVTVPATHQHQIFDHLKLGPGFVPIHFH